MEPAYVEELNLNDKAKNAEDHKDHKDHDEFEKYNAIGEANPISNNLMKAVKDLQEGIYQFKKNLFKKIINKDTTHDASDLGAMMSFHALFLQSIAYWIGGLDNTPVPPPSFGSPDLKKDFNALTNAIHIVARSNSDGRTQVYQCLFKFSNQHAFDLGKQEQRD